MDILTEKEKREIRAAKIFAGVVMVLFIIITVGSLVYAFLTKGKSLSFEIFIIYFILLSNLNGDLIIL